MPAKRRLILGLALLIAWGITFSGIALSQEGPALLWQGHALTLERMTTDWDEVMAVSGDPYPAEGALVLALLTCTDGEAVTDKEIEAGKGDFLLTDSQGNQKRPMECIQKPDGYDLGLVFYVTANRPELSAMTLEVSPPEEAPNRIVGTELAFLDYTLTAAAVTTDRASLGYYEEVWPEDGYLVAVEFRAEDGVAMSPQPIADNAYQIVLTDGEGHSYSYAKGLIGTDLTGIEKFWLAYAVTGDPPLSLESLQPAIRWPSALWVSAAARSARTEPFEAFIPSEPTPHAVAFALEDHSRYKPKSAFAAEKPAEAFESLEEELGMVVSECMALLGSGVTAAENPDKASVLIGIGVRYPFAGDYGTMGSVSAYNCTLTLTAYDALTHSPLAALNAGNYYGNTISVSQGVSSVWKWVPSLEAAEAGEAEAFVKAVLAFWGK